MRWYSVRAVYLHGVDPDGVSVFEERVMLFRAADLDGAVALAEDESRDYLAINPGFQRVGDWAAFSLHPQVDGRSGRRLGGDGSSRGGPVDSLIHAIVTGPLWEASPPPLWGWDREGGMAERLPL